MLRILYVLFALIVIGGYGFATLRGLELSRTRKQFAPQTVRGASSGARAYWYGGYRGGK